MLYFCLLFDVLLTFKYVWCIFKKNTRHTFDTSKVENIFIHYKQCVEIFQSTEIPASVEVKLIEEKCQTVHVIIVVNLTVLTVNAITVVTFEAVFVNVIIVVTIFRLTVNVQTVVKKGGGVSLCKIYYT